MKIIKRVCIEDIIEEILKQAKEVIQDESMDKQFALGFKAGSQNAVSIIGDYSIEDAKED